VQLATDARLPVLQPFSVDGEIPSVWFGPETVSRLAIADSGETLGLFNASEPTPTEPRRQFAFRTAVLGFGLEDVAPPDRPTLLQAILTWFASRDGVRVANGAATNPGDASFVLPVVTPEVVER
ncbi:MAG: hypothetical protein NZ518_00155, partial [Dehalococcoidia bacterium]|nr:hypothetical protein [Dehalococcoidia bacterium]